MSPFAILMSLFFLIVALGFLQLVTLGRVRQLQDSLKLKQPLMKPQHGEPLTLELKADTQQYTAALEDAKALAMSAAVAFDATAEAAKSMCEAIERLRRSTPEAAPSAPPAPDDIDGLLKKSL